MGPEVVKWIFFNYYFFDLDVFSLFFPLFWPCHFSVKAGVDHFKHGRHVEAMNEYNKALEIDTNNVEALVARGALWVDSLYLPKSYGIELLL